MTCECGAPATREVYNGRDTVDICETCHNSDETIWMEAVIAFNMDVMSHSLASQSYAQLRVHPTFQAEAVLEYYLVMELELRGRPSTTEHQALTEGAITRYDEWYASSTKSTPDDD